MPRVHLLNVAPGDCTVIQHLSGRVSVIDICGGNRKDPDTLLAKVAMEAMQESLKPKGNFAMCRVPTQPISYMKSIGVTRVFRFILTHPDMDHMDGLERLNREIRILNFWDTGYRRTRPAFGSGSPYREEDWKEYERIVSGGAGVLVAKRLEGDVFKYANQDDSGGGGDGLAILAPDKELLIDPDENDDINESSYVLLYRSFEQKIVLPGDAHDLSWGHVINNHKDAVKNAKFLLAPHHGRNSDRSFEFLDVIKPKLTLFGCAPSEYLSYEAWKSRGLDYITSNQAGNVVLDIDRNGVHVYIENDVYAQRCGKDVNVKNDLGYVYYTTL